MVLPAPFGPRSPNTEPGGDRHRRAVEGEDAARVALGQALDHGSPAGRRDGRGRGRLDGWRRLAGPVGGPVRPGAGDRQPTGPTTIGGSCGLPQPGIAPGPGRLRLDRPLLAARRGSRGSAR